MMKVLRLKVKSMYKTLTFFENYEIETIEDRNFASRGISWKDREQ
jgi:hypothetical protein